MVKRDRPQHTTAERVVEVLKPTRGYFKGIIPHCWWLYDGI